MLPSPITSLIGRKRELEQLWALFDEGRLVSVVGVGGCGKTRLAAEFARRAALVFDASHFVDMFFAENDDLVNRQVLEAIGARGADEVSTIAGADEEGRQLIIIDGCEQVLPGTTPLIRELLARCPRLSLLVTSRRRLWLDGDRVIA